MEAENGRLLVRIDERVATILKRLESSDQRLDNIDEKVDVMSRAHIELAAIQATTWKHHEQVHKDLTMKKNLGDAITAALAVVAGILGVAVKQP